MRNLDTVVFVLISKAYNSRVIGRVCQSVSSEPYGSNFGWFAFWRDRSDPAAYVKHYRKFY